MEIKRGTAFLSFTERGAALAERLRHTLGGVTACTRHSPGLTAAAWTAEMFPCKGALVYVGAVGIAVRSIAPHLKNKAEDPAVVAVDECGCFAVPLLSGHLGGANELAEAIAEATGGTAVITTATDRNGVFAVDDWARRQNLALPDPHGVKAISANLLHGGTVRVYSRFPIAGTPPKGVALLSGDAGDADIFVDVYRHDGFCLVPRILTLGIGCHQETARETLERHFACLCQERNLWPEAFTLAATIDRRRGAAGLLAFCQAHGWPPRTFPAEELRKLPGTYTVSPMAAARVGVDNVCERSAVLAAWNGKGEPPVPLVRKITGEGVTLAAAACTPSLDWTG